jgi:hypothetical protein
LNSVEPIAEPIVDLAPKPRKAKVEVTFEMDVEDQPMREREKLKSNISKTTKKKSTLKKKTPKK